jgi:hypothetical protein
MQIDPAIQDALRHLDLKALDESPDIVYFLDCDFVLRGFNKAWVKFGEENGGWGIVQKYGLGAPVFPAIPESLQLFYQDAYRTAMLKKTSFEHDFQCSSPDKFRVFHQTAYPLPDTAGVMIVNTIVETRPHSDEPMPLSERHFKPGTDIITICCHCRKTKDQTRPERWEWVPEVLSKYHASVSHGLCVTCHRSYYPEHFTPSAKPL